MLDNIKEVWVMWVIDGCCLLILCVCHSEIFLPRSFVRDLEQPTQHCCFSAAWKSFIFQGPSLTRLWYILFIFVKVLLESDIYTCDLQFNTSLTRQNQNSQLKLARMDSGDVCLCMYFVCVPPVGLFLYIAGQIVEILEGIFCVHFREGHTKTTNPLQLSSSWGSYKGGAVGPSGWLICFELMDVRNWTPKMCSEKAGGTFQVEQEVNIKYKAVVRSAD